MSASRGDTSGVPRPKADLSPVARREADLYVRFVAAAGEINSGRASAGDFDLDLPTGRVTEAVTAILEAGRWGKPLTQNMYIAIFFSRINAIIRAC